MRYVLLGISDYTAAIFQNDGESRANETAQFGGIGFSDCGYL